MVRFGSGLLRFARNDGVAAFIGGLRGFAANPPYRVGHGVDWIWNEKAWMVASSATMTGARGRGFFMAAGRWIAAPRGARLAMTGWAVWGLRVGAV